MPGIRPVLEQGPLTFSANVLIKGGQLVIPDGTTGRIKPATAKALNVLGLAIGDASAFGYTNADTTDAWDNPVVNGGMYPPNEVAVAYRGVWRVKFSGSAVAFGQYVVAAANGLFQGYTAGTDTFDMIVGKCVEPLGVTSGNITDGTRCKVLLGAVGAA